jgi:hypothetical protein
MSEAAKRWWSLLKRRSVQTKDASKQLHRTNADNELRKCLGPFDTIMLGIGKARNQSTQPASQSVA